MLYICQWYSLASMSSRCNDLIGEKPHQGPPFLEGGETKVAFLRFFYSIRKIPPSLIFCCMMSMSCHLQGPETPLAI